MGYKSKYGNHLLSLSEGYELVARYNRECDSVEIADLTENPPEWIDYDPTRGASDKVLTDACDSLYDRALLQELGLNEITKDNFSYHFSLGMAEGLTLRECIHGKGTETPAQVQPTWYKGTYQDYSNSIKTYIREML